MHGSSLPVLIAGHLDFGEWFGGTPFQTSNLFQSSQDGAYAGELRGLSKNDLTIVKKL